jgi:hypothetical protein
VHKSTLIACTLPLLVAGAGLAQDALPIIPGAHGFGIETPAGSGRHLDQAKLQSGWDAALVARWSFDDGKPGGALQGDAALAPNGQGLALRVSGKGSLSLAKADGYVKPGDSFTVTAWVRLDKPFGAFAQNTADDGSNWYLGSVRHGIQKWMFGAKSPDGASTHAIWVGDPITEPKWRHFAAVYDGETGAMRLYINACMVAQTGRKVIKALPAARSAKLSLGGGLTGMIDDVMLFSALLTQEQILAIHADQHDAYLGPNKTTVYKVTNLNTEGPGSLAEALAAVGPRVVVFEVSGNIDFTPFGRLGISNPYITVAGQTAPSPGITLIGCELGIGTHDVLLEHIRIRAGDQSKTGKVEKGSSGWTQFSERDCMKISGDRIVLDHCTFSWATDELVQTRARHITFRRNLFAEALASPKHHKGTHSKALLILDQGSREVTIPEEQRDSQYVAVIDNLFAFNGDRNPVAHGCAKLVVANNFVYCAMVRPFIGMSASLVPERGSRGGLMLASLVGNHYDRVPHAIRLIVRNGSVGKVYLGELRYTYDDKDGKVVTEHITDPWTAPHMLIFKEWMGKPITPERAKVDAPPIAIPGYTVKASHAVRDFVLKHAGARPADRSPTDARVVQLVRERKGKVPGTLDDVGGWPELAENRRELTLPENPSADDDGDGYTNLEEWLHGFAAEVEEPKEFENIRVREGGGTTWAEPARRCPPPRDGDNHDETVVDHLFERSGKRCARSGNRRRAARTTTNPFDPVDVAGPRSCQRKPRRVVQLLGVKWQRDHRANV